jgi:hypothetical protein
MPFFVDSFVKMFISANKSCNNMTIGVVGFASSFDVELLLILYQNLMLGLLVLQHDDLLT